MIAKTRSISRRNSACCKLFMKLNSLRMLTVMFGGLLAVVALGLFWVTTDFPLGRNGAPGPELWPRVIFSVMFGTAMYLTVDALQSRTDRPFIKTSVILPAGFMAITIVYLVLAQKVGFFLMTALFLAASMWMLGVRSWKMLVGVSVGFPVVSYIVFVQLLHGSFPEGWLAPLLDRGL